MVDVREFAKLARLAERYGLLVLHWSRSDVQTFLVHDDSATYRDRTGTARRTIRSLRTPPAPPDNRLYATKGTAPTSVDSGGGWKSGRMSGL